MLFSSPECRAVVVELEPGEAMGDHRVRERAVVHVVAGRVSIDVSGETAECGAATVVTFAPGEQHGVQALEHSLLLLILAPWPAAEHYTAAEAPYAQQLPVNASVESASTNAAS